MIKCNIINFISCFKEVRSLIEKEAQKSDNEFADSFIVIIYGTPDDFDLYFLPEVLNDTNAPLLRGKPKLLYVIGLLLIYLKFSYSIRKIALFCEKESK